MWYNCFEQKKNAPLIVCRKHNSLGVSIETVTQQANTSMLGCFACLTVHTILSAKVLSREKAGRKFSNTGEQAPGYRLSPNYFQKFKRMPAPDWAQKMLCIIVPNERLVVVVVVEGKQWKCGGGGGGGKTIEIRRRRRENIKIVKLRRRE